MKKQLNLFYITCDLLKSGLISYEKKGYKIKDSNIYMLDSQDKLMFSKGAKLIQTSHYFYSYEVTKIYTLEEIIDELPLEFKSAIIFHMDLA